MSEEMKQIKKKSWLFKGGLIAFVVIISIPFFIVGALYLKNIMDIKMKGELVIKLLNEEYHDKFAIAMGQYIWATEAYQFKVYPVNEPDFQFNVLISKLSKSGISCNYLYSRRWNDLMKQVKPYINALTEKNFYIANPCEYPEVNGKINSQMLDKMLKDAADNQITSVDVFLEKYPYKLEAYSRITYCYDVTEENKDKIAKAIYNLLCFYRAKKFGIIDICASFYKPELYEQFRSELGQSYYPSTKYDRYETHYISICEKSKDKNKITDYRDIEHLITKLKPDMGRD